MVHYLFYLKKKLFKEILALKLEFQKNKTDITKPY